MFLRLPTAELTSQPPLLAGARSCCASARHLPIAAHHLGLGLAFLVLALAPGHLAAGRSCTVQTGKTRSHVGFFLGRCGVVGKRETNAGSHNRNIALSLFHDQSHGPDWDPHHRGTTLGAEACHPWTCVCRMHAPKHTIFQIFDDVVPVQHGAPRPQTVLLM